MLELALRGKAAYWFWMMFLAALAALGTACYLWQFNVGLKITGLSRDIPWGFYIAQLTFLVGVAASAVMLVLPYYVHNHKVFGRITVIGEFTAVASICMCLLFLFVDIGQPTRALNIFIHATPTSIVFWDGTVLTGYLFINMLVGWNVLQAERSNVAPPRWLKPFIYFSIPLAFAIHTVTAFLYCGLASRSFWHTAVLAPRFLASAFAAGPAFLILVCMLLKKYARFDAGDKAINTLGKITLYGLLANLFLLACEVFTTFYSSVPSHMEHFIYLYMGLKGKAALAPWMWTSIALMFAGGALLFHPASRIPSPVLALACVMVFLGTWIDKGIGLITGGFVPSTTHAVTEYIPTLPELLISTGIYAIGFLCLTTLLKIVVSVKNEAEA